MAHFIEADRHYRNAVNLKIVERRIESAAVAAALKCCMEAMRQMDRGDPLQSEIRRNLLRLRTTIMFTLLPFKDSQLEIAHKARSLSASLSRLPFVRDPFALITSVERLLADDTNPKWSWIETPVLNGDECSCDAVLLCMAFGRSFGMPVIGAEHPLSKLKWITSAAQLSAASPEQILLVGATNYLSRQMYAAVFHSGKAARIDVMLYSGETFNWLKPATLDPDRQYGSVPYFRPPHIEGADGKENDGDETLAEYVERFAGGVYSNSSSHVEARLFLLDDGYSVCFPEHSLLTVLGGRSIEAGAELVEVSPRDVREGDTLIIRLDSGTYLTGLGEREEEFDKEVELACDWRPALEAMLLTQTPAQIATEMRHRGAENMALAGSIRHWAEGSTYGPGTKKEFGALIGVLMQSQKLQPPMSESDYVADRWQRLCLLRGGRQRLGQAIRRQVLEELSRVMVSDLLEGPTSIATSHGQEFQVRRVAAVEERARWIPRSDLMRQQKLLV